jgi:hypothetical protein
MVFLAFTRQGYEELISQLKQSPSPLWVNDGILSITELERLRKKGMEVSNFSIVIDINDRQAIENAINTVKEHHAGHRVWVEYIA